MPVKIFRNNDCMTCTIEKPVTKKEKELWNTMRDIFEYNSNRISDTHIQIKYTLPELIEWVAENCRSSIYNITVSVRSIRK